MIEKKTFKEAKLKKPITFFEIEKPVSSKIIEGDCFTVMDGLIDSGSKFDLIFADPPYFLSNGGVTCQSGKMVKVDKGDWLSLIHI